MTRDAGPPEPPDAAARRAVAPVVCYEIDRLPPYDASLYALRRHGARARRAGAARAGGRDARGRARARRDDDATHAEPRRQGRARLTACATVSPPPAEVR